MKTRPYPTVRQQKIGTTFKINGKEYHLLKITDCAALVQLIGGADREVSFKDAEGEEHSFVRAGGRRFHIAPSSEIESVTGWVKPPATKDKE